MLPYCLYIVMLHGAEFYHPFRTCSRTGAKINKLTIDKIDARSKSRNQVYLGYALQGGKRRSQLTLAARAETKFTWVMLHFLYFFLFSFVFSCFFKPRHREALAQQEPVKRTSEREFSYTELLFHSSQSAMNQ
jgi:hypothetical protein